MPKVNGKTFPYTAKGKAEAKKAEEGMEGEMAGNAEKRRSNPFVSLTDTIANKKKYGKNPVLKNAKMAALSAMRKDKMK